MEGLRKPATQSFGRIEEAATTAFLWTTYRWMSLGLMATGVSAWIVANSQTMMTVIFTNRPLFYGLLLAQLGMVLFFNKVATTASTGTTALMFMAYSALTGVTMASIFVIYTAESVAQVFFVAAASFAGLAFFGATTKRDLSAMGRFMFMGLIGLVVASIVNIFLQSPAITFISTYVGVLVFAGLTAYDNQKLKAMYLETGERGNAALRGALILYLDFINLFLMLLHIFGKRRD